VDGALIAVDVARCPVCGLDLRQLSRHPYEMKLLRALAHPLGEVRGRAARLLGECGSPSAFAPLRALASEGRGDPFVAAEALRGVARLRRRYPGLASPDWEKFRAPDQPA
jgi:HEAT repeat protein